MILTVHFSFSSVLVFIFGVFVGIIWGAYIYVKRKKKLIVSHIDKKFTTLDVDKQKEVNDLVNNIYLIHKTTHKGPHKCKLPPKQKSQTGPSASVLPRLFSAPLR